MTRDEFVKLMTREFDGIVTLNKTKGHEYAGDDDALSNFKQSGQAIGITPEQAWAVFAGKHFSAIQSYCREGQVHSEPIEGRVRDLILYGYLLLGLIAEKQAVNRSIA